MKTKLLVINILCFLVLALGGSVMAQNCTLKGKIVDGATNSPLFYTRVSLMENDSSTNELYMSFTGADGQFAVEKVSAGDYVLKAVLVGYDFLSLPLHIEQGEAEKDLGVLPAGGDGGFYQAGLHDGRRKDTLQCGGRPFHSDGYRRRCVAECTGGGGGR